MAEGIKARDRRLLPVLVMYLKCEAWSFCCYQLLKQPGDFTALDGALDSGLGKCGGSDSIAFHLLPTRSGGIDEISPPHFSITDTSL